tara:strand:- start:1518 stop:1928 length:411 start_codon:yes stop_codon:yes gene_type:complete
MRTALLLLLIASLQLGCAAHEHLHVYGRVLDVSKRQRGVPVEGAEIWTLTAEGVPQRQVGLSSRRGEYEVEVPPGLHEGGIGFKKPGYRSEWWPIGRLKRSERRAHTKSLDLFVVREDGPAKRPRAGQPFAKSSGD